MNLFRSDEEGELILCGPNIMQGYWKRPEADAETFVEIDGAKMAEDRRSCANG